MKNYRCSIIEWDDKKMISRQHRADQNKPWWHFNQSNSRYPAKIDHSNDGAVFFYGGAMWAQEEHVPIVMHLDCDQCKHRFHCLVQPNHYRVYEEIE